MSPDHRPEHRCADPDLCGSVVWVTEPSVEPPGSDAALPIDPSDETAPTAVEHAAAATAGDALDLDAHERTLDDVAHALQRLDDGTYWTNERTGDRLPDVVLEADPTARHAP